MNRIQPNPPLLQRKILRFVILILAAITVLVGLWLATDAGMGLKVLGLNNSAELNAAASKWKAASYDDSIDQQASEVDEAKLRSPNRQSAQFGTKPVEPAPMLAVLANGKQTVEGLNGNMGYKLTDNIGYTFILVRLQLFTRQASS